MEDDWQFRGIFDFKELFELVSDAEGGRSIEDFTLGCVFRIYCGEIACKSYLVTI
jgi:hypothetical protein